MSEFRSAASPGGSGVGRRLRVAYAIRDLRLGGGTENHLMQLFQHLDRSRFEPYLYCLWDHGELVSRVREMGIPVFDGRMRGSLVSPAVFGCIGRFARAFRRDRIDIVHAYLPRGELVGSVAARLARVPVVICSKRGCHERRGAEGVGARISNKLADRVLSNARAVQEFVATDEGCPQKKMLVIENGVDAERFAPVSDSSPYKERLGLDPRRPVVGTVTRARIRKGYEELLRAAGAVCASHPEAQIVVVGQDTREQAPRALIEELGFGDRLHLLGVRTDIPDVLAAFDIFVLASHGEGMSNAVMEAMSVGKPVVATDAGGTREMVERDLTGLLVPPKDPAALATAIEALLDDPGRAAEMGRRGRRIVDQRFSLEQMVRRIEALYETLWAEVRGRERTARGSGVTEVTERERTG